MIDATVALLRAKGAASSGTKEILQVADAPRGSFYFHFPDGKDQLLLEALERAAAATEIGLAQAFSTERLTVPQAIERYFEALAIELQQDDYRLGCAVGSTTLESAAVSEQFRSAVDEAFTRWIDTLVAQLRKQGLSAEDARVVSDSIVTTMEGATMLARAQRDVAPVRHSARVLVAGVEALLAARPSAA